MYSTSSLVTQCLMSVNFGITTWARIIIFPDQCNRNASTPLQPPLQYHPFPHERESGLTYRFPCLGSRPAPSNVQPLLPPSDPYPSRAVLLYQSRQQAPRVFVSIFNIMQLPPLRCVPLRQRPLPRLAHHPLQVRYVSFLVDSPPSRATAHGLGPDLRA